MSRSATYGVSPAFIVSLYGQRFSVDDFCQGLTQIQSLGFRAFQPEIVFGDTLGDWLNGGAARLAGRARQLGLQPTQFVAHFMHGYFATPARLHATADLEILKQVIDIAREFEGCHVLTIPVLPFQPDRPLTAAGYAELEKHLLDKISAYLMLLSSAGMKMAFEIVPLSIVGGCDRLLRLGDQLGSPDLGVNLDTGHAWAGRENMALLPFKLKDRIFGLHLKDNNSNENLPLAPGRGTIDWPAFLASLIAIGYQGSFDIEIGCKPDQVALEYCFGMDTIKAAHASCL